MKLSPKFVVDEGGERTAVLLPLDQYHALLGAVEDRLDAIDLEEAVNESPDLIPYEQVREQLRAEGKL